MIQLSQCPSHYKLVMIDNKIPKDRNRTRVRIRGIRIKKICNKIFNKINKKCLLLHRNI